MDDQRERLEILVGEWVQEVDLPGAVAGTTTFEWLLDRRFLLERATVPLSGVPDGLCVIAPAEDDRFTQHYYDSRGVVRIYDMQLRDGVWTLQRTRPDFSPLSFWQRFEGRFSGDGTTIDARWEASHDEGATWELDFTLRLTRAD